MHSTMAIFRSFAEMVDKVIVVARRGTVSAEIDSQADEH